MRRRLAQVDAAHMPAYLEASRDTNVPLYASFGFELMGEITFSGGPTIYPMWRKASLNQVPERERILLIDSPKYSILAVG